MRPALTDDATSFLLLANGDQLSAEDIVGSLGTGRGRELALAVLAACSTGATGRGYDEAFSLGTAFLARGVRSVVSALWRLPDDATSVLIYLLHRHLRDCSPADALRQAQLAMIEPDDCLLAGLPEPMSRVLANRDCADVTLWAGFVHAGR